MGVTAEIVALYRMLKNLQASTRCNALALRAYNMKLGEG
jgi:hypothetical protein